MNDYKSEGCENCRHDNAIHLEAADCYIPRSKRICDENECRYRSNLETEVNNNK